MKNTLLFFLIFFCLSISLAAQPAQSIQSKERVISILKKYNAEGYQIIKTYQDSPTKFKIGMRETSHSKSDFDFYIRGSDEKSIVASLGTVVHEINHGYTSLLAMNEMAEKQLIKLAENRASFFFINANQQILVPHTTTFPSKLISTNISDSFKGFRYDQYIISTDPFGNFEKDLGTQQSGAYGLMDEWNAYFQDTKTNFQLYDYFIKETKQTPADWRRYLEQVNGVFYAYGEFKYYILTYLNYAKANQIEVYNGIINNSEYRKSFQAIDKGYAEVIEQYFQQREKLFETLREKGLRVDMKDGFTFIGNQGIGNFMNQYTALMEAMAKPEYEAVLKDLNRGID